MEGNAHVNTRGPRRTTRVAKKTNAAAEAAYDKASKTLQRAKAAFAKASAALERNPSNAQARNKFFSTQAELREAEVKFEEIEREIKPVARSPPRESRAVPRVSRAVTRAATKQSVANSIARATVRARNRIVANQHFLHRDPLPTAKLRAARNKKKQEKANRKVEREVTEQIRANKAAAERALSRAPPSRATAAAKAPTEEDRRHAAILDNFASRLEHFHLNEKVTGGRRTRRRR